MLRSLFLLTTIVSTGVAYGETLFEDDFEEGDLRKKGWYDINDKSKEATLLSFAGEPEVKSIGGKKCLRIDYPLTHTGGWMHINFKPVDEVYVRYYRLFPEDWEWPKGHGPHDTVIFAGKYVYPTGTDLSVYLDFNNTSNTLVRVATAFQKWGYSGYGEYLRKKGGAGHQVACNVAPPDKVQLGKWHCVEYYAKLSDPGKENGRLKLWVNGKLCCDLGSLCLVDEKHSGIRFDHLILGPYFHRGSHKVQHCYMDGIVISTGYVGTIEQKGNQPPQARFRHSREWGSMTAKFGASRSEDPEGKIAKYAWDFGDGQAGDGQTVSHTYDKGGDYKVKLTVTDDTGQSHSAELGIPVGKEVGSGTGLKGEYWDGEALDGPPVAVKVMRKLDAKREGWNKRFLCPNVGHSNNGDNFSCRWTGFLQPVKSEEYTLTLDVNDGARVWLDGKLILDAWDKPQSISSSVGRLEAGRNYPIKIEFRKGATLTTTGDWKIRLYWESLSTKREIIPTSQVYPPEDFEEL